MEQFLIYIGKSSLAAGAFYIAFLLLFQEQKQFKFNRIYLPVSFLLSFVIPLITFTTVNYIELTPSPVNGSNLDNFVYPALDIESAPQSALVWEWYHYLFGIFILGMTGFFFHLLLGHLKAIFIVRESRVLQLFNASVNLTKKDVHPFSFFSKIVISEKTMASSNLEMIIEHEKVHVKEKHTLDILISEVLFLFQWFNPFAWLLKDAIKNNLEFKTDHEIVKRFNPQTYQLAMVALANKKGVAPFLTALNGSQLKTRIVMMKKKPRNKYARLKQLVVFPLLAILVMGLSNKEVKTIYKESESTEKTNDLQLSHYEQIKANNEEVAADTVKKVSQVELSVNRDGNKNTDSADSVSLRAINKKLEPLYFLDGKVFSGDFDKISPDDIAHIEVIKGENAEAKYGELGKNGAILITTKKAKSRNTQIDYRTPESPGSSVAFRNSNIDKAGFDFGSFKDVTPYGSAIVIVDGQRYNSMEDAKIETSDIANISVLKNETAAGYVKIYGEQARNGVIIINTKTKYNSDGTTSELKNQKYK